MKNASTYASPSARLGQATQKSVHAGKTHARAKETSAQEQTADAPLPQHGLTPRALIIGAIGSAILTASSLFIALKMGALPWPIVFAALVSVAFLRLFKSKNLHEANVCHAAMSAGAMVAGGLAFTVPGLWILGNQANASGAAGNAFSSALDAAQLSWGTILLAALSGTITGLIISAALQPLFIRKNKLAYPIGTSAAQTLLATNETGKRDAKALFGAMGGSALFALCRDNLGLMPAVWSTGAVAPGVTLGVMNSPMMGAIGFIIGTVPAFVWFLGALIGLLGIGCLLPALGVISAADISGWQSSLGLGLMMGTGAGAVLVQVIPATAKKLKAVAEKRLRLSASSAAPESAAAPASSVSPASAASPASTASSTVSVQNDPRSLHLSKRISALILAGVVSLICLGLHVPLLASLVIVAGAWFCGYIAAWLTGTTGVNPMEIFGVLVLLLIQVFFHELSLVSLFMSAAIVAVACGIVGDVMNDLKAGDLLVTNPRDQFLGMVVGGLIGAVVAASMLYALFQAYGASAFGPQSFFIAAQASVVATMAGGIPVLPLFVCGICLGCILALCKLPVMTLGLGIYLPFYMSAAAFIGALLHFFLTKRKKAGAQEAQKKENFYVAAASGILGGESLIGVISALIAVAMNLHV